METSGRCVHFEEIFTVLIALICNITMEFVLAFQTHRIAIYVADS